MFDSTPDPNPSVLLQPFRASPLSDSHNSASLRIILTTSGVVTFKDVALNSTGDLFFTQRVVSGSSVSTRIAKLPRGFDAFPDQTSPPAVNNPRLKNLHTQAGEPGAVFVDATGSVYYAVGTQIWLIQSTRDDRTTQGADVFRRGKMAPEP